MSRDLSCCRWLCELFVYPRGPYSELQRIRAVRQHSGREELQSREKHELEFLLLEHMGWEAFVWFILWVHVRLLTFTPPLLLLGYGNIEW